MRGGCLLGCKVLGKVGLISNQIASLNFKSNITFYLKRELIWHDKSIVKDSFASRDLDWQYSWKVSGLLGVASDPGSGIVEQVQHKSLVHLALNTLASSQMI